jgi:histidine triad (HIT) family protein
MPGTTHANSCLFCRIVRGDLPSARVLETDHAVALLDINPVNHGHVLLLPRAHCPSLADTPDDVSAELGRLLPRLARAVMAATGAPGDNVIANLGEVAGQTVHHLHWHVIPRHPGDHVHWPWPHQPYAEGVIDATRARIIAALA